MRIQILFVEIQSYYRYYVQINVILLHTVSTNFCSIYFLFVFFMDVKININKQQKKTTYYSYSYILDRSTDNEHWILSFGRGGSVMFISLC